MRDAISLLDRAISFQDVSEKDQVSGDDVRKTHRILSQIIPLKTYEIKSGTKVNDWHIPHEWNVKNATLKDASGKILIDFKSALFFKGIVCNIPAGETINILLGFVFFQK